ncbi:sigma-70 family RNA polymerase sigma factor [Horticoccus luteus]|uniref:Sigma-70 family RNA polymerase sigma factor n=1 Tax=Horticoccus luteus TaxID=2862869 RepID=A0A8F9XG42_9BACT|nr:sigma-70 family RNA polymerase sigma factor [Horticoccus luteus]QYM78742.1 sigma-70 family RNA polymerase sigma factor [Horticoccus luteus]
MSHLAQQALPLRPITGLAPEMSDAAAVRGVIAGSREMFEVIVRRYNAQLYRVGMAYLRDHAAAEDAMQNAYLKAFLHLRHFNAQAAFGTWLTRIMINECLMILRRKKRSMMETIDDSEARPGRQLRAMVAPDALANHELKSLLEDAIKTLPRVHRAVYLMREVQELSTKETAQCLSLSPTNVKVILHRAREGLKSQLMKSAAGVELFDYTAVYCDPMTSRVMSAIRSV